MFNIGDKVVKGKGYIPNEFDSWGRGFGIGEVVAVEPDIDVMWTTGRCYEDADQIMSINELRKASCAVIIKNGEVLAVSRKNNHSDFGLPGGKADGEETFEEAIIREMDEETGYQIKIIKELCEDVDGDFLVKTFLCELIGEPKQLDPIETGVVKFLPYETLMDFKTSSFHAYNKRLYKKIKHLLK